MHEAITTFYYDLLWMTCSITKGDILYWSMERRINDMKCVEYVTLYCILECQVSPFYQNI